MNDQIDSIIQQTVIFTASRRSEQSQESREYGYGIFTYAIIRA